MWVPIYGRCVPIDTVAPMDRISGLLADGRIVMPSTVFGLGLAALSKACVASVALQMPHVVH